MTFIKPRPTCYLFFNSLLCIQSFVDHIPLFCLLHFKKRPLLTNLHLPEGEKPKCSVHLQLPVLASPLPPFQFSYSYFNKFERNDLFHKKQIGNKCKANVELEKQKSLLLN